jgi:ribosome modulation factor
MITTFARPNDAIELKTALNAGWQARMQNKTRDTNPYCEGDARRAHWLEGYDLAWCMK